MSVDRSLYVKSGAAGTRNVLKRAERIEIMKDNGDFDEENGNPIGLPKTRVKARKAAGKPKKEAPAAEAAEE